MRHMPLLLVLGLNVLGLSCCALNIALHAQVSPAEKIVGSVITTDGLKRAFKKVNDVRYVDVFYPFQYPEFFDRIWDLILIEGWFPSINDFIALARSHCPQAIVIFYCLDPTYPGLSIVTYLDVDGFLTNSQVVFNRLSQYAPTQFVQLAADPTIMAPNNSIPRAWASVYVGAGGGMVNYKPVLREMLLAALPFGLRLHGSHWSEVDILRDAWQGILPRFELAAAYASAHVVIATTIESQGSLGMINNRIFEALSCGAVIISDDWPALRSEFGDIILFAANAEEVRNQIQYVLNNPGDAGRRRERARQIILERHTWAHRVVQILQFFNHLRSNRIGPHLRLQHSLDASSMGTCSCGRPNCPLVALIIGNTIASHPDYSFISKRVQLALCEHFDLDIVDEDTWTAVYLNHTRLSSYDVLIAVTVPFDTLDRLFASLPIVMVAKKGNPGSTDDASSVIDMAHLVDKVQRRAAFWIGYDRGVLADVAALHEQARLRPVEQWRIKVPYDAVWYRDAYELNLLQRALGPVIDDFRLQHFFTVLWPKTNPVIDDLGKISWRNFPPAADSEVVPTTVVDGNRNASEQSSTPTPPYPLFICFFSQKDLCDSRTRSKLHPGPSRLLLVGGEWRLWLLHGLVVNSSLESSDLQMTTHVPGECSLECLNLITSSEKLYIINRQSIIENDEVINTVEDVTWPLLTAFSSEKLPYVHLLNYNRHLVHLTELNFDPTDVWYLQRSIGYGVARLHGFGRATSSVTVLSPMTMSHAFVDITENAMVYPVKYTVQNFVLGVDGQCCFSYANSTLGCAIRTDVEVFLRVKAQDLDLVNCEPDDSSGVCKLASMDHKVSAVLELRGPMFSDAISVAVLDIQVNFLIHRIPLSNLPVFLPNDKSLVLDIDLQLGRS